MPTPRAAAAPQWRLPSFMHGFCDAGTVQLAFDGEAVGCFDVEPEIFDGPYVKFNANSNCCSVSPDNGLSNLRFYMAQ